MLQPEQLKTVSETFPTQIADLQAFFTSAGIETGTSNALPGVAARLASDRPFQRDLCSHVWVVLHGSQREISYADLLGAVAIAAAGSSFAANARDSDAHDLLRFLMEARDSLEHRPAREDRLPARSLSTAPGRPPGSLASQLHGTAGHPLQTTEFNRDPRLTKFKRPAALLTLAALCVATAFLAMTRLRERTPPVPASAPAIAAPQPVTDSRESETDSAAPNGPSSPVGPSAARRSEAATRVSTGAAAMAKSRDSSAGSDGHIPAAKPLQAPDSLPRNATAQTPAANFDRAQPAADSMPAARGSVSPLIIPSTVLSKQIGARTLPPDYALEDRSYDARYPRLLRRRPMLPLADESGNDSELVASNNPPALFRAGGTAAVATIVRPVSLGTMAANVLYSPAPAYPPAAAAARVQGEVRVQAEVDRDGNVAFARVISGPALLRDAAVDAVQRWRYRPYLSAGRPVAMSATAVLDFQLQ